MCLHIRQIFASILTHSLCVFDWKVSEKIEDVVQIVFLPLYFTLSGTAPCFHQSIPGCADRSDYRAHLPSSSCLFLIPSLFPAGLKTDISEIHDARDGAVLVVVLLTAIAAKFVGCSFGAKLTGLTYRESAVVGVLVRVYTFE
jgi:Kef-type K+ transport system membrane component KefB